MKDKNLLMHTRIDTNAGKHAPIGMGTSINGVIAGSPASIIASATCAPLFRESGTIDPCAISAIVRSAGMEYVGDGSAQNAYE